jgi:hypothetical protein
MLKGELFRTIRHSVRWVALVVVVYFITDMFKHLGDTGSVKFDMLFNTLINISGSIYISYTIAISSMVYGYAQRKLRQRNIKEMSKRIDNYEKMLWPGKTSSQINTDGTTPEE